MSQNKSISPSKYFLKQLCYLATITIIYSFIDGLSASQMSQSSYGITNSEGSSITKSSSESVGKDRTEALVTNFVEKIDPTQIKEFVEILCNTMWSPNKTGETRLKVAKLFGFKSETPVKNILEGKLKKTASDVTSAPYSIAETLKVRAVELKEFLQLDENQHEDFMRRLISEFKLLKPSDPLKATTLKKTSGLNFPKKGASCVRLTDPLSEQNITDQEKKAVNAKITDWQNDAPSSLDSIEEAKETLVTNFMAEIDPTQIKNIIKILCKVKMKSEREKRKARLEIAELFGFKSPTPVDNVLEDKLKQNPSDITSTPRKMADTLKNKLKTLKVFLKLNDTEYHHFVAETIEEFNLEPSIL